MGLPAAAEKTKYPCMPEPTRSLHPVYPVCQIPWYGLLIQKNDSVPALNKKDEKDIAKKLDETLGQLESSDGLMFDGEVLDEETKELLKISLENALRTAKVTAKKKFTPKKYKND